MIKQLWLNLPVKDIKRSKAFFTEMGFTFNPHYGNSETSLSLMVGDKGIVVMLFDEAQFKAFAGNEVADTSKATEVLISVDAASKAEVDEMAARAIAAGGQSPHQPTEMTGWMYGCLIIDPDGHRWNVLYMDMSKMPKG